MAENTKHEVRQLYRSSTNRVIAGVAGGIGKYFTIDPTIIRFLFILMLFFGGSGVILYLVLWLIMPANSLHASAHEHIQHNAQEMKDKAGQIADEIRSGRSSNGSYLGMIIIIFGLIFFLNNFGIIDIHQLWPIILILLGVFLLFKR